MSLIENLKGLRAACAVALTGSSMEAARLLHLSQPSITRAIQTLELNLQGAVFDRTGRGMRITPAFKAVLERCAQALQTLALSAPGRGGSVVAIRWTDSRLATGISSRHIRVFQSLATTGSETASALQLGISQSAVHQILAQLEHMAGGLLFTRSRLYGLRMTDAAIPVLRACKLFVYALEQADEVLAANHGKIAGRLVIGTLPFSVGPMLPQAVERLLGAHPAMQVTLIDGTYDALMQRLRDAEIDLMVGALRLESDIPGLVQEPLFMDPLAVVARASHPLLMHKNLRWSDLHQAQWIMPMPNTPAQWVFERTLRRFHLDLPASELRVNSASMMQSLLMQGERLAMMSPRQIRNELRAGLLVALPLPIPDSVRTIGLIRRSDLLPTPGMQMLLRSCREVAHEITASDNNI